MVVEEAAGSVSAGLSAEWAQEQPE